MRILVYAPTNLKLKSFWDNLKDHIGPFSIRWKPGTMGVPESVETKSDTYFFISSPEKLQGMTFDFCIADEPLTPFVSARINPRS